MKSQTLWQIRLGSSLANLGFRRKGKCVVCGSRAHYEFGWEDFCLGCTNGRLSDATYEALGWERPSSTVPKENVPESPVRWLNLPEEAADAIGCAPGIWLNHADIVEAAEKWDSDMVRLLANIKIPQ